MSDSPDEAAQSTVVKPLTKVTKDGRLYSRMQEVEEQIASVLRLPFSELQKRLDERDEASSYYLIDETLVYLLREAMLNGDDAMSNAIALKIYERSLPQIKSHLRKFVSPDDMEDCINSVWAELFSYILNLESNRGDYAQVRFRDFLKKIAIRVTQKRNEQVDVEKQFLFIDEQENNDAEDKTPFELEAKQSLSQDELIYLKDSLNMLPDNLRTAFVLYHLEDWQIESNDAQVPTIAGYFNKTPRTIRNWIREAEKLLKIGREEKKK